MYCVRISAIVDKSNLVHGDLNDITNAVPRGGRVSALLIAYVKIFTVLASVVACLFTDMIIDITRYDDIIVGKSLFVE